MMLKSATKAFTLIEILVVIAVIAILASMLGGVYLSMLTRAVKEGQANDIKKVLHATEQFKSDFGEYPAIDAANTAASTIGLVTLASRNWATHNSLAYRLFQGVNMTTGKVTTADSTTSSNKDSRQIWAGSYLTATDFPEAQIVDNELLDRWGSPLSYCMMTSNYLKQRGLKKTISPTPASDYSSAWVDSTSGLEYVTSSTSIGGVSVYGQFYAKNQVYYARPSGTDAANGYLAPISYAKKGEWIDSEVNLPEIWSWGEDKTYKKFDYNSGDSKFKVSVTSGSTTTYPDQDNIGGNQSVMQIQ